MKKLWCKLFHKKHWVSDWDGELKDFWHSYIYDVCRKCGKRHG